ncbi:MAG: M48 family metalloprotease [Desulfamplus sp.]|nr:M48 family metalloprotease [Desulfamplus sp.]
MKTDRKFKIPWLSSIFLFYLAGFITVDAALSPWVEAISISEEKKIAREFMDAVKKQDKLIQDPFILSLVSEIGEKILGVLPPQTFEYSFNIVDEDQFNAFAGPGANIFVYRGLITALDNLDELAGIIGHEIAHASCRHISDMVDRSKLMNIGTLAGVLAGVLVGASSKDGGPDLAQAMVMGSMAAGQTLMLSYSREHEREADQKGLEYIAASGFDPRGLLTGLEKIRSRDWFGMEGVPDYLKTHPGSTERIVNIQSWLDRTRKTAPDGTEKGRAQDGKAFPTAQDGKVSSTENDGKAFPIDRDKKITPVRFEMARARLAGIYGDIGVMESRFSQILSHDPENCPANYGMALVLERKSRLDQSLDRLRRALAVRPFDQLLLMETARISMITGDAENALRITDGLDMMPELETETLFIRARALLMQGREDEAEKLFDKVIHNAPHLFPRAYYYMARIKGGSREQGKGSATVENQALSHYYLGLYYHGIKNIKNARFHLEKSLETLSDQEIKQRAQELLKSISMEKKRG